MHFSDKPAIREFRAAAKLVNEWRDTLSYTAIAAVIVADVIQNRALTYSGNLAFAASTGRELVRCCAWANGSDNREIAGYRASDTFKKTRCLFSGMGGLAATSLLHNLSTAVINRQTPTYMLVDLSLLGFSLAVSSGPRGILKTYRDVMWDYPRKNRGGGGTTQNERLLDGLTKWFSAFSPSAIQPAYAPIKRPHNGLRHEQKKLQHA